MISNDEKKVLLAKENWNYPYLDVKLRSVENCWFYTVITTVLITHFDIFLNGSARKNLLKFVQYVTSLRWHFAGWFSSFNVRLNRKLTQNERYKHIKLVY